MKNVEIRKTGVIVDYEGVLVNPADENEKMYVFGLKVEDVVLKCHYTTKDDLEIELGDYAMINGSLYDISFGFVSISIVNVAYMTLVKMRDFEKIHKDFIFIADYKVRGQELPANVQNGFVIRKENKTRQRVKIRRYGIFHIEGFDSRGVAEGSNLGLYDDASELINSCHNILNCFSDENIKKLVVVDFKEQTQTPIREYYKNAIDNM